MGTKRILVIDDEPYILQSVQNVLEDIYDVDIAQGGVQAIEVLKKEDADYDLVLCDLAMPDINGANLYLEIIKQFPKLEKRIVFMTGSVFAGYINTSTLGTSHPCITKPFDYDELHKSIKKFLRNIETQNENDT